MFLLFQGGMSNIKAIMPLNDIFSVSYVATSMYEISVHVKQNFL